MNTAYPIKHLDHLRPILIGFRKVNGLTQKAISERLGVSQQAYARFESNPSSASFERLFRVFTVLGIELSGNDSNLLIVFYVQIMPDDFIMQLHRF
ncbi:helix-turn-helix transcriptional regulator [Klebsiella pneumoniae]